MEFKSANKLTIVIVQYLSLLAILALVVLTESSPVYGQLNARDGKDSNAGQQSASKYQKIVVAPNRLLPFRRLPLTNRYDYALTSMDQMAGLPSYLPMAYIMDRDMKNMNRYYLQDTPMASSAAQSGVDQTEFVRIPNELSGDLFNLQQAARFYPQFAAIKSKNQRLISSNEAPSASSAAETASDNQQQQQSDTISVQTRSLASASGNSNMITSGGAGLGGAAFSSVPRSFISVLYGRPGASGLPGLPGIGGYNKKAEPKDNFFMHFG